MRRDISGGRKWGRSGDGAAEDAGDAAGDVYGDGYRDVGNADAFDDVDVGGCSEVGRERFGAEVFAEEMGEGS
jgi:hypothetical protein